MKEISLKRFITHFGENLRKEKRFCFILGAGASRPSGIPTGGEMVRKWIEELKASDAEDLTSWLSEKGIKEGDYESHYSDIFDKRFEFSKKDGFAFLEKMIENAEPSCGYSVLSQILAAGKHNIVITTNFDSLTEDALFIYTHKKPLVIGHSSLADYISINLSRPLVVKIHHDLFLTPKNGTEDVACMDENFSKNLKEVFKYYTPLVIGYGGNDGSLMNFLSGLDNIEEGIFWFYIDGNIPKKEIVDFVDKVDGHFVPIKGFDDLMIQLGDKLKLEKLDSTIESIAKTRADNYRKQIENITKKGNTDIETKEALNNIATRGAKTWWNYELLARDEKDINKANEIYLKGIKEFPNSAELLCNYALFLNNTRKQYDDAQKYYLKALEIAPEEGLCNYDYAIFLDQIRKQYDDAQKYYLTSLKIDSDEALYNEGYAIFLHNIKMQYDDAQKYYLKALEINPENANTNSNYAIFLHHITRQYNDAQKYYLKALEIDPENANANINYASFVHNIRKQYNDAQKYYLKALKIDPADAAFYAGYALLLQNMKQYDEVQKYYLKALKINPDIANINGNYAKYLIAINENDEAIKYINKAFELNQDVENDLAVELWFYCYAIFPNIYPDSRTKIEELLDQGIKSIGWDFTEILKIAEKEKHPDYLQLVEYAKRITQA